jgi:hypothetical protein
MARRLERNVEYSGGRKCKRSREKWREPVHGISFGGVRV